MSACSSNPCFSRVNCIIHRIQHYIKRITAAAKSLQSCLTLCDSIDGSPPGSPRSWDSPDKNTGVGCHFFLHCMKVKSQSEVAQLCLTPSDPKDCSPPGSWIHGILQARVLEWGATAFSKLDTITKVEFILGMQSWCHTCKSMCYTSLKHKTHFIISTETEKWFDKIQHHFKIKESTNYEQSSLLTAVFKTPCFHCRGQRFHYWLEN